MNNKTGIRRKQEDTVVSMLLLVSHMGSPVAFLRQQTFFLSLSMFEVILFQIFSGKKNPCFIFCISDLSR